MGQPITAGLPPFLDLAAGFKIRLTALDPTSGATVTGVRVTNAAIYVRNLSTAPADALAEGEWYLLPGGSA